MGVGVFYAVGGGELFQSEHGQMVFVVRPCDAFGAQGVAGADDVEQIPAGIAVLVAVFVGVEEVAVEGVAGDFVVVTDVVEADGASVGLGKFGVNPRSKFGLGHAFLVALLRGDTGNQHGFGRGQVVVGLFAIECDGVGDEVEIGVGADASKLRGAVAGGVDAECFVVVEKEGGLGHGFLGLMMVGQPENGTRVFRLLLGCWGFRRRLRSSEKLVSAVGWVAKPNKTGGFYGFVGSRSNLRLLYYCFSIWYIINSICEFA